jgi:ubiquinone/menaquinone biosynthesis C-methylase UbiE
MESIELQKQLAIDQHSRQAQEFSERYNALNDDAYNSCFTYSRRRLDLMLDQFMPARGDGLRLLDLGCGTGYHMARYSKRGFELAGVDGSEEMLKEARAANPGVEFRQSDVDQIPYADNSFDFILCIEVLRYLPDPSRSIREMARVLRPGGVCLVTAAPLLNSNGYWFVNRFANLFPAGNLVRLKQFFTTSGKLRSQFTNAGFDEAKVHGVYTGPINWIERIRRSSLPGFLRRWESIDARIADRTVLREFSNMFLVKAVKVR